VPTHATPSQVSKAKAPGLVRSRPAPALRQRCQGGASEVESIRRTLKDAPIQRRDAPAAAAFGLPGTGPSGPPPPPAAQGTGLPDHLKAGVEALSGLAMDDVRVHRNSPEPAKLGALAYAQGTDIHLGAGQERHLPHEAWHVVQQKQGRVPSSPAMPGRFAVNADATLEREADDAGRTSIDRGMSIVWRPRCEAASGGGPRGGVVQLQALEPKAPVGIRVEFDEAARLQFGLTSGEANPTNAAFLIRLFQEEYGMEVAFQSGRLVYVKDVGTPNSISPLARSFWMKQLTQPSRHSILLSWNSSDIDIAHNVPSLNEEGEDIPKKLLKKLPIGETYTRTEIDLAEFDLSNYSVTTVRYQNVPARAFNLARILEHELLVHGEMNTEDNYSHSKNKDSQGYYDQEKHTGWTVDIANKFAKQMGLARRTVYTARAGKPYQGPNGPTQDVQITFEGGKVIWSIPFPGEIEDRGSWFERLLKTTFSRPRYRKRLRR
jgi:hypothetical protein